jgi:hypothetical protein
MVGILGANSVSGGYEIDNSLRFNDGDNAELTRTPGSEGDKQIHTISMWIKRCTIGTNQALFSAGPNDSNVYSIRFLDDSLYISQSSGFVKDTDRLFRDPSAWYHIVIAIDTTDGTQNDRIKVYINGVLETSFAENSFAGGQNLNTPVNDDVIHAVGYDTLNDSVPFDGYISEFHLIDGTQKAASDFGETDDNGVWIPKAYDGSYGTNGVYLEFKQTGTGTNASGMGADTSGNTHHYAPVNLAATDVTTDTPTNNFATINPLLTNDGSTHSEGNTKLVTPGGPGISGPTIAMTAGKWYAEFICTAKTTVNMNVGIVRADSFDGNNQMDEGDNVGYMYQNTGNIHHGGADESYGASWAVDDIIGIAFNADNLNVEFFKNGAGQGNYTRIASENTGGDWFMCVGEGQGSGTTATFECNFGNPPSAVSSSNADADGHGNFEYAPPSGYFALCTKNLAEYGG